MSIVKNFIINSMFLYCRVGVSCKSLMFESYVGISWSLLFMFLKLVGSIIPSEGLRDLRLEFNK